MKKLRILIVFVAAIKLTAIDESFRVLYETAVNYDSQVSYNTKGGVHRAIDGDPNTVTTPPQLWISALEMYLIVLFFSPNFSMFF